MNTINKWPKHIEECIKASLEHGPSTLFQNSTEGGFHRLIRVLEYPNKDWHYVPPKPPYIEQWGNEYPANFLLGTTEIRWKMSKKACDEERSIGYITTHYRRIDAKTGKTIHSKTLEVFK